MHRLEGETVRQAIVEAPPAETYSFGRRRKPSVAAKNPHSERPNRPARALRRSIECFAISVFVLFSSSVGPGVAGEVTSAQMQSLDEQVQEIKSDVLSIAAELSQLEEMLLYPSNTQVAVFVALEDDEASRLDSIRIQIDGELVAHHIYSFKELEALQKGGVQRIYTGNVPTGDHQLDVAVAGKLSGGRDFSGSETFSFTKEVEPKLVGLTLSANEFGGAGIRIGDD